MQTNYMDKETKVKKLISFDLVGTLTEEDALYRRIHKIANCQEKALENVNQYIKGKITEKQLIQKNTFYHKGISLKTFQEEARSLLLRKNVKELIENLKKQDYKLALITSDYDIAAQYIKQKFNLDYAFGCKEVFDAKGFSNCSEIIDSSMKLKKLKEISVKEQIPLSQIIYIGNDTNDNLVFKETISIAYDSTKEVKKTAKYSYDGDIIGLLNFINGK